MTGRDILGVLWFNALSNQAIIGIGPDEVLLNFVSLGFKHLKMRTDAQNCTTVIPV